MAITALVRTSATYFPNTSIQKDRKYRYGNAENPRRDSVLPYSGQHFKCTSYDWTGPYNPETCPHIDWYLDMIAGKDQATSIRNRALLKLQQDKLGVEGDIGTFVAELGETFEMIVARATALRRSYSALKRGQFRRFLRTLNVRPLPKHKNWIKSSPKEASNLWLEYWFGWAPTVSDISFAVDRLQNPFPVFSVHASSFAGVSKSFFVKGSGGSIKRTFTGICRVRLACDASVSNPNLYLANQLGFVNPVSVAYNRIPFSWLVDWALPIGDFLSSWTAYLGLNISKPCSTVFLEGFAESDLYQTNFGNPYTWQATFSVAFMQRTNSLPSFVLKPEFPNLSPTRAATAMSLLALNFKKPPRG